MKRLLLIYFLFSTFAASAQLTNENFDSYNTGAFDAQWNAANWVGWFGGTSNVDIDNTFSHSAPNSMLVNSTTDDIVALLGTLIQALMRVLFTNIFRPGLVVTTIFSTIIRIRLEIGRQRFILVTTPLHEL